MADLRALQKYASRTDLDDFPPSVLFAHSPSTLTIFDAYPKSMMHFLIIPRTLSSSHNAVTTSVSETELSFQPSELDSLKSLVKVERHKAQRLLLLLRDEAEKVCLLLFQISILYTNQVKASIQEEMMIKHGFTWPVWIGVYLIHDLSKHLCDTNPRLPHCSKHEVCLSASFDHPQANIIALVIFICMSCRVT
jgi:aprataxin